MSTPYTALRQPRRGHVTPVLLKKENRKIKQGECTDEYRHNVFALLFVRNEW
jgi:hypothetical protein